MQVKALSEISTELGIPDITLRRAIHRQAFPAQKSGGTWLINIEDKEFMSYLQSYRQKPRRAKKDVDLTLSNDTALGSI